MKTTLYFPSVHLSGCGVASVCVCRRHYNRSCCQTQLSTQYGVGGEERCGAVLLCVRECPSALTAQLLPLFGEPRFNLSRGVCARRSHTPAERLVLSEASDIR